MQNKWSSQVSPEYDTILNAFLFGIHCRYHLPIVIIVVNNNGIYSGLDQDTWKEILKLGEPSVWWVLLCCTCSADLLMFSCWKLCVRQGSSVKR